MSFNLVLDFKSQNFQNFTVKLVSIPDQCICTNLALSYHTVFHNMQMKASTSHY